MRRPTGFVLSALAVTLGLALPVLPMFSTPVAGAQAAPGPHSGTAARTAPTPRAGVEGMPTPHAQTQTSPIGLDRISCADSQHCVVVGTGGTALLTTDGGQSWNTVATGSSEMLFGVDCVTDQDCWAVGENGTILATANGGTTWSAQSSGTTQFLYGISCPTTVNCWAVGDSGTGLVTANGGMTWTAQDLDPGVTGLLPTYFAIYCPTTSDCIGANNEGISVTGNGGVNWLQASPGIAEGFFDVTCAPAPADLDCWAVGSGGSIIYSTDGGGLWTVQQDLDNGTQLDYQYNNALWAVSCPSANGCYTVGAGGAVETTTNTGTTWTTSTLPAQDLYFGISCPTTAGCVTDGSSADILGTTDAGASWTSLLVPQLPASKPVSVMMVGDSVSFTLGLGLAAQADWYGASINDQAVLGCGVTIGGTITILGQSTYPPAQCNGDLTASNPQLPQIWEQDIQTYDPQVVLLVAGHFETVDREFDGSMMNITEPIYQQYVLSQLRMAVQVLSSKGAHVVLATSPYFCEPASGTTSCDSYDEDDPVRIDDYNDLVAQVAAEFPNRVSVLDLNSEIDPNGTYAEYVDGVQVRNPDGIHIQLSGGEWLASWLLPQVVADASTTQSAPGGYWMAGSNGNVYAEGDATNYGSMAGKPLSQPIVSMAATPDGKGYWLVASDGGIFSFGDASFYGSTGAIHLNKPIVGMAATPDGNGYWLVASDGGIFTFGDASFYGSTGAIHLNKPIAGMAATPDGNGYWLVASDGGIFTFGDASFYGSTGGTPLVEPIVGMAADPATGGYWLVAADGGIFTFGPGGQTPFEGSASGQTLSPVAGMAVGGGGFGYWLATQSGTAFSYGSAPPEGSASSVSAPVVAVVATP